MEGPRHICPGWSNGALGALAAKGRRAALMRQDAAALVGL